MLDLNSPLPLPGSRGPQCGKRFELSIGATDAGALTCRRTSSLGPRGLSQHHRGRGVGPRRLFLGPGHS